MRNLSEKVNVVLENNIPLSLVWKNRDYKITKIGIHHNYFEGKTLIHIFSVLSGDIFLKLKFNTKYLTWNLIEIFESI